MVADTRTCVKYPPFRTSETIADALDQAQKETIDAVLRGYGDLSGRQLSVLTHLENPWREARGDLPPTERSNEVITLDSMQEFYGALDADEKAEPVEDLDWKKLGAS